MHKNMYYKNLIIDIFAVTFRKEGVDWNFPHMPYCLKSHVTFRKEGVDWNIKSNIAGYILEASPSARKVWIEIWLESEIISTSTRSPSARKVWIEIPTLKVWPGFKIVTFRKEGVDWNRISAARF